MRTLLILVALIALSGCDTTPTKTATSNRSKKGISNGGIARYAFHRNAGISDVKKTLPDGSIDYVDFDMADNPSVLVVVTASAPPSDGLTFTTAFSGEGNLMIKKNWSPTTNAGDHEHVGIFVLPKSITNGRTFRSRGVDRASIDDIIFH